LQNPGGRDITAHVDFGTCKAAALKDADVHGPVTQGDFLQRLGIAARAEMLAVSAGDADRRDLQAGLLRLVSPGQMGRLFKVMALTPPGKSLVPAGFESRAEKEGVHHG
jgi:NADH dehydrogenase [ubiquinone] 1 alpha subcomplex assembly factor 7